MTAIIAGVVVTLLILSIAIAVVIVFILVFLHSRKRTSSIVRRRKPSVNDLTHSTEMRLTKADIEWQIPHVQNGTATSAVDVGPLYATISKVRKSSSPALNVLEIGDSETLENLNVELEPNFYDEAKLVEPNVGTPETNIYDEASLPRRRMTNSSAPKLAKLKTADSSVALDQNPIYESSVNIASDSDKQEHAPQPVEEKSDAIYAQPMKRKPSAPREAVRNQEPVYSETLTPAMFKQASPPDSSVPVHPYGPIYAEPTTSKKSQLDSVKVVKAVNFVEQGLIGIGQFGEVVLAQTVDLSRSDLGLTPADNDRSVRLKVAIKKLGSDAENPVRENFDKEITFMSRLKNENIVQLLAIGRGSDPFIVMEYMENGDLHQYLEAYEEVVLDSTVYPGQIPVSLLVSMSAQIANGMKYLASHNYVHRDLATRNCLVGEDMTVKIADFGMSRNLYGQSYYKVHGRAMLPIRWMARECFYGRFSEKTDIWAFGVAVWEIFTLGRAQPYEYLEDQEVIQEALKEEARLLLERPDVCPQGVYDVMLHCWETKAKDRAGFKEVFDSLNAIYHTM